VVLNEQEESALIARLGGMKIRINEQRCSIPILGALQVVAQKKLGDMAAVLQPAVVVELASCRQMSAADWQATAKAMAALSAASLVNAKIVGALSVCLVRNSGTVDRSISVSLRDCLSDVLEPSNDLVLALADHRFIN
jgi:hypothetical protein